MRPRFDPWVRKIPWRRNWLCTPIFLPGESQGQTSLAGQSPWGHKESDTTELLTDTTLSCGFYLTTSQGPHLQIPSHGELRFHTRISGSQTSTTVSQEPRTVLDHFSRSKDEWCPVQVYDVVVHGACVCVYARERTLY